jgi:hypothetical protein
MQAKPHRAGFVATVNLVGQGELSNATRIDWAVEGSRFVRQANSGIPEALAAGRVVPGIEQAVNIGLQQLLGIGNSQRQLPTGSAVITQIRGVSLKIEGFGSIHAAGPEMDLDDLQAEVKEANKKLTALTQPYGIQDPDRLQVLRDLAKDLDQKIGTLTEQLGELLGEEPLEGLQAQLAELDARILERTGRFPAWKVNPPLVSGLQSALEAQRKEIETTVVQAEDSFDQSQVVTQAVEKRRTETEAGLKNARLNLDAANGRLTVLTRDGLTDGARHNARREALMAWEAARNQAGDCEKKLAEIGEDPQKSVENLERQLNAQEGAESALRLLSPLPSPARVIREKPTLDVGEGLVRHEFQNGCERGVLGLAGFLVLDLHRVAPVLVTSHCVFDRRGWRSLLRG